jgi:hypothetical protein
MKKQVRSIKGELVNFDLSEIKEQIGNKAPTTDVKNREKYIYSKRRRGSKRAVNKALDENTASPQQSKPVVVAPSVAQIDDTKAKKETKKKIVKKDKRKK